MCGIVGIAWDRQAPGNAGEVVRRMAASIEQRGPDSEGRSVSEFATVGFRRLSILDLAGGHQPLKNEDGTIECFLNGEIYNYRELRDELEARGHVFHTTCDTEVLPHLYEELGTGMFGRLNGMFAICVVDHRSKEVVLGRDHFGIKPMYYARTTGAAGGVVFGSEVKALLASGLIDAETDDAGVLAYLTLFYCPGPHTLVRGVMKLPPGSLLRLKAGGAEKPERYYDLPVGDGTTMGRGEAAERVRGLLADAVRRQLQADVPVGISLSGGVDSSAVAYAATLNREQEVVAFTVDLPEAPREELASAEMLCEHLGLRHQRLTASPGDMLDLMPLVGWLSDEPVADPAFFSQLLISAHAAEHVKVLLSGAGGDEVFGGYHSYFPSTKRRLYARLPGGLQRGLARAGLTGDASEEELAALADYRGSRLAWHSLAMSSLSAQEQAMVRERVPGSRDPYAHFRMLFDRHAAREPLDQQMAVDLQSYLPEQVFAMLDRATMAVSIEGRVPLLDVPLVEQAFRLPTELKVGHGEPKRLLKEAIAAGLPTGILERPKTGFPSPVKRLVAQAYEKVLPAVLLGEESYVRRVAGAEFIGGLLKDADTAVGHWRVLYGLLLLEVWHKVLIREGMYKVPTMRLGELYEGVEAAGARR